MGRRTILVTLLALLAGTAVASSTAVSLADDGDSAPTPAKLIPQPPLGKLNARTRRRLAPASRRVDLVAPSFSSTSAKITNPLFPVSSLISAVLVGRLEGVRWRAETTLLPRTETVPWNGMRVRTLRSQFVAYLGGRIFEVAVDRYAQAKDGSVWYFGEDAYTYRRGRVVDTEGTWLAGKQGPPAMIMPAHPHPGAVYRTENIPGLVFEEVTVEKTGETVKGPTGPVHGAMVGRELHMDEIRLERKVFAPGYGEFSSGGGRTFEATALVVPADARAATMPVELKTIFRDALGAAGAADAGNWTGARSGWARIRFAEGRLPGATPRRLATEFHEAAARLADAIRARDRRQVRLRALEVADADLDLQLQYRPPATIDSARFGLWALRTSADARAGDRAGVLGDVATLGWIRDRRPLAPSAAAAIDRLLRRLTAVARAGSFQSVAAAAARLQATG
jgi:hypothetical protein